MNGTIPQLRPYPQYETFDRITRRTRNNETIPPPLLVANAVNRFWLIRTIDVHVASVLS